VHGFSGQGSYTWSHTLDLSSDSNGGGTLSQQFNPKADYGNANWDIRHRFVGVLTYELPAFRGSSLLVRETLGGWQLNDIVNLQTGTPFNVVLGYNSAGLDQGTERPSWVHKPSATCNSKAALLAGSSTTAPSCIDTTAYTLPVAPETVKVAGGVTTITAFNYAYGNTSRNTLHGPGFTYDNFSLFKNFAVWKTVRFQFRAEAFNVFNHPSASNPNATNGSGNPTLNAASQSGTALNTSGFGQIISTQTLPGELSGARVLSLSGKIIF
jgi:hypothetical protein